MADEEAQQEVFAEIPEPARLMARPRRLGRLKGRIVMSEDFDCLPEEILDAMEGRDD